jgi:Gpi18-like mannosyltransferase
LGRLHVVLQAFLLCRFLLVAVGCVAALVQRMSPIDVWDQWDAQWYLGIAQHGYHWGINGRPAVAFFPLLPLLLRAAMSVGIPGTAAGLIFANAAFLGALFYLHALFRDFWGETVAARAVWLVVLVPISFFTFAPYSEPLFLLGAAGCLYHAHHRQPGRAGLLLAVALLCRSTGIILVAPLITTLWKDKPRSWLAAFGPSALCWAIFMVYLHWQNLALTSLAGAQVAWHRSLTFPWTGFTTSVTWLLHHAFQHLNWSAENITSMGVTILLLVLTLKAWPQLSTPLRVYCVSFWLFVLATPEWRDGYYDPFSSVDRFALALFPLAGYLANRIPPHRQRRLMLASSAGLALISSVYLAGGWVG